MIVSCIPCAEFLNDALELFLYKGVKVHARLLGIKYSTCTGHGVFSLLKREVSLSKLFHAEETQETHPQVPLVGAP